MSTPTMTSLRLAALILDEDIQPRQRLDPGTIDAYADLYTEGVELPPLVVFQDGADYYLSDGFHRTHAARTAGLETLTAEVHRGTKREAILYASAANGGHGLQLSDEDKRRIVTRLLQDPEWREWSDNAIAKHCRFAQSLVSKVRRSLSSEISENQPRTYRTRHGTVATMRTGRIGRKTAPPTPVTAATAPPPPERTHEGQRVDAPGVLADGSALPVDQHLPYFHLSELVQESVQVLAEIHDQLGMLEEDYRSFTATDGKPFPSTWAFATTPAPDGPGCDLSALLTSAAPLVTLLETLKAQAEAQAAPPVEPPTNVQRVREVLPELSATFAAPHVAAKAGLTTDQARRALERLTKAKAVAKVPGKPGQYRRARKR